METIRGNSQIRPSSITYTVLDTNNSPTSGYVLSYTPGGMLWASVDAYVSGVISHNALLDLTVGDTHTQYVGKTPTIATRNLILPSADIVPLTIKEIPSQAANIVEYQNSAGTIARRITKDFGVYAGTPGAIQLTDASVWSYQKVSNSVTAGQFYATEYDTYINPATTSTANYTGFYAVTLSASTVGAVRTVNATPTNGGIGYTAGDVLTLTQGSGDATVTVSGVDGSGRVTSLYFTSAGTSAYTVATGRTTSGGTGSGCTVNVTGITTPSISSITGGSYRTYNNTYGTVTDMLGIEAISTSQSVGGPVTRLKSYFGRCVNAAAAITANAYVFDAEIYQQHANGSITSAYNFHVKSAYIAAGTIGTWYGLGIDSQSSYPSTNMYGISIGNISGGTVNVALVTNAGNVIFNEGGDANTDFRVESDTESNMIYLDSNAETDGVLYLGGTTNGIKINKGGDLTLLGNATVWEDLRLEPKAKGTGATNPSFEKWFDNAGLAIVSASGTSVGVNLYSFDDAAAASEKDVWDTIQLPHAWAGTSIYIHTHWVGSHADTTAAPRWGLEYNWKNIGEVYGATTLIYSDGKNYTLTGNDTDIVAGKHYLSKFAAIAPTAASGISSILTFRLFRNSSSVSDTYDVAGNKCGLLYVDAHYELNSMGSKQEYIK